MATNIAPHNLVEVVQACRHLIDHPDADLDDAHAVHPRPRLPTGGKIVGLEGIRDAYATGNGSFRMRATARVDNVTARRKGIVVTELPYNVGPETVIEAIKKLVQAKKLQGISDIKNLTDRHQGLNLVIEVKSSFHPEAVLEQLYKLHADGVVVLHQRGRPGRRPAADAGAQGDAHRLPRPPLRGRPAAHVVPPRQGGRSAPPGRRLAHRARRHRRGHPARSAAATNRARRESASSACSI